MYKMKFHWEKEDNNGSFTVTAMTVDQCLAIGEEEVEKAGAELTDWYVI